MTLQHILDGAPEGATDYIQCSDGVIYIKKRWNRFFKWSVSFKKFVLIPSKCNIENIIKPLKEN